MEPDHLAEGQRRGLTIDLGFVWTTLPPTASTRTVSGLVGTDAVVV
jgi:selenocysteine-specific translation elongation factor